MGSKVKGRFTFKVAGVFFFLSAVFELINISSETTLFGMVSTGFFAAVCHMLYCGVYTAIGVGIWFPTSWGAKAVYGGTVFYTLDMAGYLLNRETIGSRLMQALHEYDDIIRMFGEDYIFRMIVLTVMVMLVGWWGFALYTYFRRDYFAQNQEQVVSGNNGIE